MKKGDSIKFIFAGAIEEGVIINVVKRGNKILSYTVSDKKYKYPVTPENFVK